jgi:hypothetical protein
MSIENPSPKPSAPGRRPEEDRSPSCCTPADRKSCCTSADKAACCGAPTVSTPRCGCR